MFRDVNLSVLDELARTWERFARKCSELEDEYEQQVIGQLARSDWRGQTADAAMRVLEGHDDVFEVTAMVASGIVTVLDQAKSKLNILGSPGMDVGGQSPKHVRTRRQGPCRPLRQTDHC
jgi:hypothetical protein